MLMTLLKVLYVVIAILMIAFILLQRGAGAQAGGGFGAGASATVFGASGSANFLSRSTKWLAALFFGLSITMAAMIAHGSRQPTDALPATRMSGYSETPAAPAGSAIDPVTGEATGAVSSATGETPALPASNAATPAETPVVAPAEAAPASPAGAEAPAASAASSSAAAAPAGEADKPESEGR